MGPHPTLEDLALRRAFFGETSSEASPSDFSSLSFLESLVSIVAFLPVFLFFFLPFSVALLALSAVWLEDASSNLQYDG